MCVLGSIVSLIHFFRPRRARHELSSVSRCIAVALVALVASREVDCEPNINASTHTEALAWYLEASLLKIGAFWCVKLPLHTRTSRVNSLPSLPTTVIWYQS